MLSIKTLHDFQMQYFHSLSESKNLCRWKSAQKPYFKAKRRERKLWTITKFSFTRKYVFQHDVREKLAQKHIQVQSQWWIGCTDMVAIQGLQLTIIHFQWDGNDASFGNSKWWTKLVFSFLVGIHLWLLIQFFHIFSSLSTHYIFVKRIQRFFQLFFSFCMWMFDLCIPTPTTIENEDNRFSTY